MSLGPVGPWGGWGHNFKNVCTIHLSWFLCQTFGGVFKFDCCLWGKHTITKMCEQFNILDFILIFVPNNWGSYRVRLLSLGPGGGDDCTNSEMSVHFNIFYSILILCQTFRGVFKLSVGPAGGRAQFLKCIYNSTFLILSLFLCQTVGGVIKLDCYLWALLSPEGGRAQFLKCVNNSKFLLLSWFLCQTFEGVIKFPLGHWILLGHWFPVRHHDF